MEREELIQSARKLYNSPWPNDALKKALEENYPELKESEDERIRKLLVWQVYRNIEDETNDLAQSVYDGIKGHDPDLEESIEDWKKCLAWLEKMKKFSDLKDGMYSCISGELILITKKFPSEDITTEPLPGTITDGNEDEDESIKVYDNMDDLIADALIDEIRKSDMPDSAKHNHIYWVNKHRQKPAEGAALQKAFINSKMDYALEEKRDAPDYADVILPTSVAYGENEEEYKLHKIIEAAFIAGQKKEQKPAEWSDEDKEILNAAIYMVEKGSIVFACENNKCKVSDWLKSLPERFNLQPKQEWSDKDESYLQTVINEMEANKKEAREYEHKKYDTIILWLKSLRPQPHWKPSEEQMKTLQYLCEQSSHPNPEVMPVLESLYNDLKKLM